MAICSLHGVVPDLELSWNTDCGELHTPVGRPGHTLNGEPCDGLREVPGTDRTVGAIGAAADAAQAEASVTHGRTTQARGMRGPMAADVDRR